MLNILISNLYPSKENPHFGTFVRATEIIQNQLGFEFTRRIVLTRPYMNAIGKLLEYVKFMLKGLLLAIQPDEKIIYLHFVAHSLLAAVPFLLFPGSRFILNFHGQDVLERSLFTKIVQRTLLGRCLRQTVAIVVPSEFFRREVSFLTGDSTIPIYVFPSGGIPDDFCSDSPKIHSKITVSFCSRIEVKKGWRDFLELVRRIGPNSDYRFLVAGGGPDEGQLKIEVALLGEGFDITFLGPLARERVKELFEDSDVFVFPTHYRESLGLVLVEAMACGCIVFASPLGAVKDIIVDGTNGFLVPEAGAEWLATRIRALFSPENVELRETLRSNAQLTARRFSVGNTRKVMEKILSQARVTK